jgi:hypothetical protein
LNDYNWHCKSLSSIFATVYWIVSPHLGHGYSIY